MGLELSKILKNTEDLVKDVLLKNENTRDNDVELVFAVWERQGLKLTDQQRYFVKRCYSSETIVHCRRKIQEIGLFRPSINKQEQRSLLEEGYRENLRKENV